MTSSAETSAFAAQRADMVEHQLRARGIKDERLLAAMQRVPRQEFLTERYRSQAYEDHPLPIGEEQTISQPYIVAIMLEMLEIFASAKVLEVGAGSGYVTALLAELAAEVFAIERHAALAAQATATIARLGYTNAQILVGDGSRGLAEHAPYDVILVSAAAAELPPALLEQLAEGGRMMIPIGPPTGQHLHFIRKQNGQPEISLRDACLFVPLIPSF